MNRAKESRSKRLRNLAKAAGNSRDTCGLSSDVDRSAGEVRRMASTAREHARMSKGRIAKAQADAHKTDDEISQSRQSMQRALRALAPKNGGGRR